MDQDDSMLSTPSSHGNDDTYDEENLFPEEVATATSPSQSNYVAAEVPANNHLNAAFPGELSPPRSNTHAQSQANGFAPATGGAEETSDDDEAVDVKGERSRAADEKSKPGAGWKNKKVQEDMQRSWEFIVDKDFDVRQFGDVLLGRGTQLAQEQAMGVVDQGAARSQ